MSPGLSDTKACNFPLYTVDLWEFSAHPLCVNPASTFSLNHPAPLTNLWHPVWPQLRGEVSLYHKLRPCSSLLSTLWSRVIIATMATPAFLNFLYRYSYPESGKILNFIFTFVWTKRVENEDHDRENRLPSLFMGLILDFISTAQY